MVRGGGGIFARTGCAADGTEPQQAFLAVQAQRLSTFSDRFALSGNHRVRPVARQRGSFAAARRGRGDGGGRLHQEVPHRASLIDAALRELTLHYALMRHDKR